MLVSFNMIKMCEGWLVDWLVDGFEKWLVDGFEKWV
jgi:hypothetical protein